MQRAQQCFVWHAADAAVHTGHSCQGRGENEAGAHPEGARVVKPSHIVADQVHNLWHGAEDLRASDRT